MALKWESMYKHSILPDDRKFCIVKQIKNNPVKKAFLKSEDSDGNILSVQHDCWACKNVCFKGVPIFSTEITDFN